MASDMPKLGSLGSPLLDLLPVTYRRLGHRAATAFITNTTGGHSRPLVQWSYHEPDSCLYVPGGKPSTRLGGRQVSAGVLRSQKTRLYRIYREVGRALTPMLSRAIIFPTDCRRNVVSDSDG